ncbi:MAG: iron ABC transporter permease [Gammaproteobacteria bacterium]|nr:iron ABC transporter permease [Gammaproteobacteria bacterium]
MRGADRPVGRPRHRRPTGLALAAGLVVALAAVPLVFVADASLGLSLADWRALWSGRLPRLLWNTLSLAVLVAAGSLALGVSAAWLVARREFPGRALAVWLMVLPLAVPTYVFAYIYTRLLAHGGWLAGVWHWVFGDRPVPDLHNLGGAALVLTLASFSYVFLLARAALMRSNRTIEEAARIQGAAPPEVFRRVTMPLLRPAVAAGLAVVVLHVLSDFGAVSMLRVQTFTLSIYLQMSGRFDYQGAAGLSLVLVALSLIFLVTERVFRSRQRYYAGDTQERRVEPRRARGLELALIWAWLGLIVVLAFLLPLAWMATWTWKTGLANTAALRFWEYVGNSLAVAAAAATFALAAGLPVAFYHARHGSRASHALIQLASVGFVLPGPVIALGVLTFVLDAAPLLYGGLSALVMALVVRFLPLSVQSQDAALAQLTPSVEEAGRVLGAGPAENLRRVVLPTIRGGLVSAWVLVFIDALKELPATLLLRPPGFDTLPVRIWIEASEEMLELAAPASLALVAATLPALWILMRSEASAPTRAQRGAGVDAAEAALPPG